MLSNRIFPNAGGAKDEEKIKYCNQRALKAGFKGVFLSVPITYAGYWWISKKTVLFNYIPARLALFATTGALAWLYETEQETVRCHQVFIDEYEFAPKGQHTGITAQIHQENLKKNH